MKKNRAESLVRKYLRKNGFDLDRQNDEKKGGTDISAMKDGQVLLIEVKTAKKHNRAWQVDAVSKKQKIICNTMAIVLPGGLIVIEPMDQHLKLCAKNGMRYLSDMVKLAKLVGNTLVKRKQGAK